MKQRSIALMVLGVCIVTLGMASRTRADGLLLINGVYKQPVSSHVTASIMNKIATTMLEQKFHNNLDTEVSATYIAPVPEDATVTSFSELVAGKWVEASVKASEQAQSDYASAVKNGSDAAIASASTPLPVPSARPDPRLTFQIQVSLPPKADRTVRLVYTQVLSGEVGLTRYTYPLSNSDLTDEKVGDLLFKVKISDSNEIRAVYSPSHKDSVEISRPDKTSAEVTYRAQDVSASQDFEVIYTQSNDKFGLNLASYRERDDEDGFFVLVAAPQLQAQKDEVVQKDFVFVLDCSGSMQGHKATEAKAALNRMLDMLNAGDRFTVIAFSSDVTTYAASMQPLDKRADAQKWVDSYPVEGGTNINDALIAGLNTADKAQPNRPHVMVFLTDGQATDGVVDTQDILQNIRQANQDGSLIYPIGVGDVNQSLLSSLAQQNRGSALFVTDTQDLTKPLKDFHAAINDPVLVNLALDFGGEDVYDVYPNPIPDMFLGGQVVVTGRYRKGGVTNVTLNGHINGEKYTSTYKYIRFIDKAEDARPYSFVSRLWAQRKVDALLTELATNGTDPAIVDQVRELGLRYHIVTPYTSFVALPKTGLPFLYTDDYRAANTALMLAGGALVLLGAMGFAFRRVAHA